MSTVAPGWYRDPVEPTTQRYWDGEGWLGEPLPADVTPPPGPPPVKPAPPPAPVPAPAAQVTSPGTQVEPGRPVPPPPGSLYPPAGPGAPPGHYPAHPGPPAPQGPPGSPTWHVPPGTPPGSPYPFPVGGPVPFPHGFALAGPGARLAARLIDVVLVLLLNIVGNGWLVYQYVQNVGPMIREVWRRGQAGNTSLEGLPQPPDGTTTLLFMIFMVTLAIWFAYEVPAIANSGQTVGKRLLGIKVMRLENTEPLGFGRSFRRWLRMGWPTPLWACYGVGLVLQALDCLFVIVDKPLRQAIHDKIAFTVVVEAPRAATTDRTEDGARP